jgi:hypothetical protein
VYVYDAPRPYGRTTQGYAAGVCREGGAHALLRVDGISDDMYPPPHMTCILLLIGAHALLRVDGISDDMYPPPHMTCFLLLI